MNIHELNKQALIDNILQKIDNKNTPYKQGIDVPDLDLFNNVMNRIVDEDYQDEIFTASVSSFSRIKLNSRGLAQFCIDNNILNEYLYEGVVRDDR